MKVLRENGEVKNEELSGASGFDGDEACFWSDKLMHNAGQREQESPRWLR